MSLSETINEQIKQAMLAKDKVRVEPLRAIKTAFVMAVSDKGAGSNLTGEEELRIVGKLLKQRQDSAAIYKEQGRDDLYEKEMSEAAVISEFMPEMMDEAELRTYLENLVSTMGATSMQQMGQVMGTATKELAGKAEGKLISQIVRELLS